MGRILPVQPVTPILGVLYRDVAVVDDILIWVEKLMGEVTLASPEWPFDLTDYYTPEMGDGLRRRFYLFDRLSDPTLLSKWKVETNKLEEQAAHRMGEQRPVNLDPGYLNGSKLVLASTKNHGHRIYIGQGVFAEVTLTFREGAWIKRDYTFPDFASGRYDEFLSKARELHLMQLKNA
jgi:hypothetical protein